MLTSWPTVRTRAMPGNPVWISISTKIRGIPKKSGGISNNMILLSDYVTLIKVNTK